MAQAEARRAAKKIKEHEKERAFWVLHKVQALSHALDTYHSAAAYTTATFLREHLDMTPEEREAMKVLTKMVRRHEKPALQMKIEADRAWMEA